MFPGKGPTGQAVRPRQGDIGSLRKTKTERGGGKTLPSYITLPPWQGKKKKKFSTTMQRKTCPSASPRLANAEALQDWNLSKTETSSARSQLHNSCNSFRHITTTGMTNIHMQTHTLKLKGVLRRIMQRFLSFFLFFCVVGLSTYNNAVSVQAVTTHETWCNTACHSVCVVWSSSVGETFLLYVSGLLLQTAPSPCGHKRNCMEVVPCTVLYVNMLIQIQLR